MMSLKPSRLSLGVDLVEIKKAKKFYQTHRHHLVSFFSKTEVSSIRRSKKPYERLALLLAAKEAVFKSLDLPWMGPGGFRKIVCEQKKLHLSYLVTKNYVVVCCQPSLN